MGIYNYSKDFYWNANEIVAVFYTQVTLKIIYKKQFMIQNCLKRKEKEVKNYRQNLQKNFSVREKFLKEKWQIDINIQNPYSDVVDLMLPNKMNNLNILCKLILSAQQYLLNKNFRYKKISMQYVKKVQTLLMNIRNIRTNKLTYKLDKTGILESHINQEG